MSTSKDEDRIMGRSMDLSGPSFNKKIFFKKIKTIYVKFLMHFYFNIHYLIIHIKGTVSLGTLFLFGKPFFCFKDYLFIYLIIDSIIITISLMHATT